MKSFAISLSKPSRIGEFRNNRLLIVFAYIFVVCLLGMIPNLIRVCKYDRISASDSYYIHQTLIENRNSLPTGSITNGFLEADKSITFFYGNVSVIINGDYDIAEYANYTNSKYLAFFTKTGLEIYLSYSPVPLEDYSYEKIGLNEFDFQDLVAAETTNAEYLKLEKAINYVIKDMAGFWKTWTVAASYVAALLEMILNSLILAALAKLRFKLRYGQMFKIGIYSMTIMIAIMTIGDLFSKAFLGYVIGSILSIIFMIIALKNADANEKPNIEI